MYEHHVVFTTYGTHLHGSRAGSFERYFGRVLPLEPSESREAEARALMKQPEFRLTDSQRRIVAESIRRTCAFWEWTIVALNVRETHVHLHVLSPRDPDRSIASLKAHASRALIDGGTVLRGRKVWTKHHSFRRVIGTLAQESVREYVLERQGRNAPGSASGMLH